MMSIIGNVNAMMVDYSLVQQAVYHGGEKAVDLIEESVAKVAMTWWKSFIVQVRNKAKRNGIVVNK
jgi:hypothetical protein